MRAAAIAVLGILLTPGESLARCVPRNPGGVTWAIESNPVVPTPYLVRGRVDQCNHQIWEELARKPYTVKIIRQPKFGRTYYNAGFSSIDYVRRDKTVRADDHAARICGEMYGKRGCVTLEYIYEFRDF